MGAASFCVVGATLGALQASFALQARFAWQAQHLEHFRLLARGRRSTWSTSGSFCMAGAALGAPSLEVGGSLATSDANGRRFVWCGRRNAWSTSGSIGVAGAALGAPRACFAWQAQHSEHLHIEVGGSPAMIDANGRRFVLRGRRSTWSTSGSVCVACATLGAPRVCFA